MREIAIAGVGLIGGSFALALRKARFAGRILGVSSERTTREALAMGAIDEAVSLQEAAARADLLFLAQPIFHVIADLGKLVGALKPGALVTDAGSTKVRVCEAGRALGPQFLGGHPMAGKEARGVRHADADLFRGRNWVLAPNDPAHLDTAGARWLREMVVDGFGARLVVLDPQTHDRTVAHTSHLVQLVSTALAATLADVDGAGRVAGPAAIEMTRVAMSDFDMWSDILATNTGNVHEALDTLIAKLERVRALTNDPKLREMFEQAGESARKLRSPSVRDLGV